MAANQIPNPNADEFDEQQTALKRVMEVFIKPDKELLEHPKCISSTLGYLDYQFVQNTIQNLQPQMVLEKDRTVIVAFNKNKKCSPEAPEKEVRKELSQSSSYPKTKTVETRVSSCSTSTTSASSGSHYP